MALHVRKVLYLIISLLITPYYITSSELALCK